MKNVDQPLSPAVSSLPRQHQSDSFRGGAILRFAWLALCWCGWTAQVTGYQQSNLLPLTLGSWWAYDDGSSALVSQFVDYGDIAYITVTNKTQVPHGPGSLNLYADSTGVYVNGYSQPNFIIVNGDMGYTPFIKMPMLPGQSWSFSLNSNGKPVTITATVTDTNIPVTIRGITYQHCTEVSVVVIGQTSTYDWVNNRHYFLPGVGCIKRVLKHANGTSNTLQAIAWDVKGSATPVVVSQPPQEQFVVTGKNATFAVGAYGTAGLKYQWSKNGTKLVNGGRISGVSTPTLVIAGCVATDAGDYTVEVSNSYGSVVTPAAPLNVIPSNRLFGLLDYFWPVYPDNQWVYQARGTDFGFMLHRVEDASVALTCYTGRNPVRTYVRDVVEIYSSYGDYDGSHNFVPSDTWYDYPIVTGGVWGQAGYDDDPGVMEMRLDPAFAVTNRVTLGRVFASTNSAYLNGAFQGSASLKFEIVGLDNVTVPFGSFRECLHLRLTMAGPGETETSDDWWAKGVGMVRKTRKVAKSSGSRTELYELTAALFVAPPRIVTGPQSVTNSLGGSARFNVDAIGSQPLEFRWVKDGAVLADGGTVSGAGTSSLVLTGLEFADGGNYSVVVSNSWGSVTSAVPALLKVKDLLAPSIAVTSHADLMLLPSNRIVVSGTASDAGSGNNGIASVTVNSLPATNGVTTGAGVANWSRLIAVLPGTNRIVAIAKDTWGNAATNIVRLVSDIARPTVVISSPTAYQQWGYASMAVKGRATDNLRITGVHYRLNAGEWLDAAGTTNWTGDLDLVYGTNTVQAYADDSAGNHSFTSAVKVVYNQFIPVAGSYYGLFADEVRWHESSGWLNLLVTSRRTYSGQLVVGGRTNALAGAFDAFGTARKSLILLPSNTVTLDLALNLAPGTDLLTGTLSNGQWSAALRADRGVFNALTNKCPYAGSYTLVLPGSEEESDAPMGFGYGALTVDAGGKVVLSGALAEGTAVRQVAGLAKDGRWPLYASLYGGKGSVYGWMQFTNQPQRDLVGGEVSWIKPALASARYYPEGYTNLLLAVGSRYVAPSNAAMRVLGLTNGLVSFAGGNLIAPFTNLVSLTANNLVVNRSGNRLALTIVPANGLFSGTATAPGTTTSNSFKGVLLQDQAAGYGYFLGTNHGGSVFLEPTN